MGAVPTRLMRWRSARIIACNGLYRVVQLVIDHDVIIRSIVRQFLASNQQPLGLYAGGL